MSRVKRNLRKKYIVFCEGDTEYNYVDTMRVRQGVELALRPINMKGGGYKNFLDTVKTEAKSNCLAKFIIVDLDRLKNHPEEKTNFIKLFEYCHLQNSRGVIPHFLITNNPDFEYIACLHILDYKGQNVTQYIEQDLKFKDIEKFKAKKDIYTYLNTNGNSYMNMLAKIADKNKFVFNTYQINKWKMDIRIIESKINWDNESVRGSNIKEFFEVLGW